MIPMLFAYSLGAQNTEPNEAFQFDQTLMPSPLPHPYGSVDSGVFSISKSGVYRAALHAYAPIDGMILSVALDGADIPGGRFTRWGASMILGQVVFSVPLAPVSIAIVNRSGVRVSIPQLAGETVNISLVLEQLS